MSQTILIEADGMKLQLAIDQEQRIFWDKIEIAGETVYQCKLARFPLVQLHLTGEDQDDHHGRKHLGGQAGAALRYVKHSKTACEGQSTVRLTLQSERLFVHVHLQTFDRVSSIRTWTDVENRGPTAVGIEYISSLALWNIDGLQPEQQRWEKKLQLHLPTNNWSGEAQWQEYFLPALGLAQVRDFSCHRIAINNTGTWSCLGHVPCAVLHNQHHNTTLFWQVESNASWAWEIGDLENHLYLQLAGPTENENGWWKNLQPMQCFTTVPVSFGSVTGGVERALQQLTLLRRCLLRPCDDLKNLPVIFNDYMNCLAGDPTTAKLLPLIDAAAKTGCEVFCIDAGWYAALDGAWSWWGTVGEWEPSPERFPEGLDFVLQHIRDKGMIPGLWLEIEVMGTTCPLAERLPDECFFLRHGKRVIDHRRYQLDFRHPTVVAHANGVIDRLVNQYGVGYIKMDYNINAGTGTDYEADSCGDGLLQHNRAYLSWLQAVFQRHPQLTIENCGSGGMRMDYAMLQIHSLQSITDQEDYRLTSVIAAAASSLVVPEQSALWSYPKRNGDMEEVTVNMVNTLLLRIHQSGHLAELPDNHLQLVAEGIDLYKSTIRAHIGKAIPVWPDGLPHFSSGWISFGLLTEAKDQLFLAVWRRTSLDSDWHISIPEQLQATEVQCIYPKARQPIFALSEDKRSIRVTLPTFHMARLFHLRFT